MHHIPPIEHLETFLMSIRRNDPSDNSYKELLIQEERGAIDHHNNLKKLKAIKLWYRDHDDFPIDSARRIIESSLMKYEHPTNKKIADCILLLATYLFNKKQTRIETLNEILGTICEVTVSQYVILDSVKEEGFVGVSFGDFKIDELDTRKLEYNCKRAYSDYYDLYKDQLKDRIAIERLHFGSNLISWANLSDKFRIASKQFIDAVLIYSETHSKILFNKFWEKFVEDQYLQVSFGIGFIEEKIFSRALNSSLVTVYLNIKAFNKKIGYVVPEHQTTLYVEVPFGLNKEIRSIYSRLDDEYNFQGFRNIDLHSTIKTYIEFNAKAYIYLYEKKVNEAFLFFVIALELLLGESDATVKSVSRRSAVLTYLSFDASFENMVKKMQKIYTSRSKFVHEGKEVNKGLLEDLQSICRIILEILFVKQADLTDKKEGFHNQWMKELDHAISSHEANFQIPMDQLKKYGIVKVQVKKYNK